MTPHELAALPPAGLADVFRNGLKQKDLSLVEDAFTQLETRFRRMSVNSQGSREFLDQFLNLAACPEVRAVRTRDPFLRIIERMEYLLEVAGDLARAITEEVFLRQVVDSRERGRDIVSALLASEASPPTLGELAAQLETTPQNLSPVIRAFKAQGIVEGSNHGRNVYLKLTQIGSALFTEKKRRIEVTTMFGTKPNITKRALTAA
jgi:DNA-binding MarR family transcriptional regulator